MTSYLFDIISQNAFELNQLFKRLEYNKDWCFSIFSYGGASKSLTITLNVPNSLKPDENVDICHRFPIPNYHMNQEQLEFFILDCIIHVHKHEAMENFKVDGEAIFFPDHGPDANPYDIKRKVS